jgi:predicted component of type VI protein secretion system
MVPLSDAKKEESNPPIAINDELVTMGKDPKLVDILIEDEAVEGLHAKLQRQKKGVFRLSDEGSTAGTWVNYSPVSEEGTVLEQGDIIHIGRAGFRFIMRDPHRVRKPVQRRGESI